MAILNKNLLPFVLISFEIAVYLSMDLYIPALPTLAGDFGVPQDFAQYTISGWFLGAICTQILIGPLSDKFGRRPCLLIGVCVFIISSFVCATTSNFLVFLAARLCQGMTVSLPIVVGYAAVHETYDDKQAMRIIALMGSITILAPALGPIAGAGIIYFYSWRIIFYLLAAWAVMSLVLIYFKLPETLPESHDLHLGRILTDIKNIMANKRFLSFALPVNCAMMAMIVWMVESPFIIVDTLKFTVITYGIVQLILFSFFILGSHVSRILLSKSYDPKKLLKIGFGIACLGGISTLTTAYLLPISLYPVVACMTLCTFGMALTFGPCNRLAIASCSEPMGSRTAVFATLMNLFCTSGTILVTFVNDGTMFNLVATVCVGMSLAFILAISLIRAE